MSARAGADDRGAARALGVRLSSPELFQTAVSIPHFTGSTVAVEYRTLPGNQPKTYGNFVALWQDVVVPWGGPPLRQEPIPGDNPSGSLIVTGVTITKNPYTLGYGVGPGQGTICACASIQPGGLVSSPLSVAIVLSYVGSNSVLVHYQTLSGYQPQANGNWVGLWQGRASPYSAPNPLGRSRVVSDANSGDVAINEVAIGIDTPYTLVYFMGEATSTAAAVLYFTTSENGIRAEAAAPVSFRFAPAPEA